MHVILDMHQEDCRVSAHGWLDQRAQKHQGFKSMVALPFPEALARPGRGMPRPVTTQCGEVKFLFLCLRTIYTFLSVNFSVHILCLFFC